MLGVEAIHKIDGKHAKMLIKELDIAIVNAFSNLLANLMRAPPLDHIQARPSVLGLGPRRGSNEEVVLELSL